MHRRTGAPVAVARRRRDAALRLLAAHPDIDVVIADDGLQHHALARDIELVVFDGRGIGNGRPLPAGPLREHASAIWPASSPGDLRGARPACAPVLVNGRWPSPPALPLPAPADRCWEADALEPRRRRCARRVAARRGRRRIAKPRAALGAAVRWLAAAGIGEPRALLRDARSCAKGSQIAPPAAAPTMPISTRCRGRRTRPTVIVTEKDAVKLAEPCRSDTTRVWVVTLDFGLPDGLAHALRDALPARAAIRRCRASG